jgi:hypothetical protein
MASVELWMQVVPRVEQAAAEDYTQVVVGDEQEACIFLVEAVGTCLTTILEALAMVDRLWAFPPYC